jgi:hypothetical protein
MSLISSLPTNTLSHKQEVMVFLFLFHLQWIHLVPFFPPARRSSSILRPLLPAEPTTLPLLSKLSQAEILTSGMQFFAIFFSTSRKMLRDNHKKLDL